MVALMACYFLMDALSKAISSLLNSNRHINKYFYLKKRIGSNSDSAGDSELVVVDKKGGKKKPPPVKSQNMFNLIKTMPGPYTLIDHLINVLLTPFLNDSIDEFITMGLVSVPLQTCEEEGGQFVLFKEFKKLYEQFCFINNYHEKDLLSNSAKGKLQALVNQALTKFKSN
jgi:hypothetical protein